MRTFWRTKTLSRPVSRRRAVITLLLVSLLSVGLLMVSSNTGSDGTQLSAAENVVLTVDADQEVYPFKDTIRGVATNNWNWLWEGLWDRGSNNSCCAPGKTDAIIDATSYINPGIIRFAGGLWANRVGWSRNGSAPDDGSWTYRDPQSGQSYSYTHAYKPAMVDSFADFRDQLGAEAIIQVNICDNNPKMWQDLVRYANVEKGYGFEYWELGNEQSLDSCGLNPTSYADRYAQYQDALKGVDPSIKILGPIAHQPYYTNWEDALVDRMGDDLDVVAWHWYQLSEWTSDTGSFAFQGGSLEAMMAWGGAVGQCQDGFGCPGELDSISDGALNRWTYRRGIAEQKMDYVKDHFRSSDPSLETAITEFGVHASAHTSPINGNHTAAIWLADMLGRWAYNGLDIITYYSLEDGSVNGSNSRGLLGISGQSRLDVRPTYYTEFMYSQYFGDMMVQSSTSDPEQKVVVWASTDSDDSGKLKLMLVNLSGDNATAQVKVNGFNPSSGEAYVMKSGNPLSMSDPGSYTEHSTTINGVKIPDYDIDNPSVFRDAVNSIEPVNVSASRDFDYDIPPYSVVALTLNGQSTSGSTPSATPSTNDGGPTPEPTVVPTPEPTVTPTPTEPTDPNEPTPTTPDDGSDEPVDADAIRLMVSQSTDRRNGTSLSGKTVDGNIYVSVGPDSNLVSAEFYLDDPSMNGDPLRIEMLSAFDLMGTHWDGSALPFDTSTLTDGAHTVTARVALTDGTTLVRSANFTVRNRAGVPSAVTEDAAALVSYSSDRSDPFTLGGATVSGQVYVWADSDSDLRQVRFYIDDKSMTGNPHQTENIGPFDLSGTVWDGTALPFDTTSLSNGAHTVTMAMTLQSGEQYVAHAKFTVANHAVKARASYNFDRSSSFALVNATVSGNLYVWADGNSDGDSVSFYIDDTSMSGSAHQVENIGPYDLNGTHWTGTALPYNTASLSNGGHTLTMMVAQSDGSTFTVHTPFKVRN